MPNIDCRISAALVVAAVLAAVPPPAAATLVLPAGFGEVVAGSHTIVHGRVVDVEARMPGGARTIESLVTVAVTDTLKGAPNPEVVFRVPNGQIGRYRRVTVGAPEFRLGDEVVVFLTGQGPAVPVPFGLHQGVYRVQRSLGRTRVTPVVVAAAGRVVRGDTARRPLTLDAFVREVRTYAGTRQTTGAAGSRRRWPGPTRDLDGDGARRAVPRGQR